MIARYGEWPSPLDATTAAAESGGISWPAAAGDQTWWCESDPATATVRLKCRDHDGTVTDVLGADWSVRNRSLGYGGRPYAVRDGLVVFTHHGDQRLYRRAGEGDPVALTEVVEGAETCWADPQFAPGRDEVWCVRETTRAAVDDADADPAPRTSRAIVAVDLADGTQRLVARSHHFLSGVRISPSGRRLAWIGWDHPAMPWDGTALMVADLVDGVASDARQVLGGADVSVAQAEWADDDTLYAMADPDGWWNLHRIDTASGTAECVLPMPEECAGALWRVGPSWFAVVAGRVVLHHGVGAQQLAQWDPADGSLTPLAPDWDDIGSDLTAGPECVVMVAASATQSRAVLRVPLDGSAPVRCTAAPTQRHAAWTSVPKRRTFRAADGRDIHAVYYPPTNPEHTGPDGELPPLLVDVHGGPTSHTGATPDAEFSLFTSRGFAVVSVDYGGSTGYGRAYRERLRHNWGIVDRDDCIAVAVALADAGEVDRDRMAIRGGSAGGWTTLACLGGSDVFCAGAVYYPISDATTWSGAATHDFESRYLISMIGRWPEDRERYVQQSPLTHVGNISAPMVMLQGADDFICPPYHAQVIVDAVAARGLWHRLLVFDGEGHGFRKASSVHDSLLAEAELYSHAMGITVTLEAS